MESLTVVFLYVESAVVIYLVQLSSGECLNIYSNTKMSKR